MNESNRIRVALVGSKGRLGSSILEVYQKEFLDQMRITHLITRENRPEFGKLLDQIDTILDVSLPEATVHYLKTLIQTERAIPYVIGSTGWSEILLETVHEYAKQACVVLAPNFAPSVNLFLKLVEIASPYFHQWGYEVILHETHHNKKRDAPSGTAKAVIEKLKPLKPQIHSSRTGNIVGTHEVQFVGPSDVLTLNHEALDRAIFARGALMASLWSCTQKKPGLYSMTEVLSLDKKL